MLAKRSLSSKSSRRIPLPWGRTITPSSTGVFCEESFGVVDEESLGESLGVREDESAGVVVESVGTGVVSGVVDLSLEVSPQALRNKSAAADRVRLVLVLNVIVTSLEFIHLKN